MHSSGTRATFVRKYSSVSFVLLIRNCEDCWQQYWHRSSGAFHQPDDNPWQMNCVLDACLSAVKLDWLRPRCNLLLTNVWRPSDKLRPCSWYPSLSVINRCVPPATPLITRPVFCQRRVSGSCRPAGSLFKFCTWNENPGFPFSHGWEGNFRCGSRVRQTDRQTDWWNRG